MRLVLGLLFVPLVCSAEASVTNLRQVALKRQLQKSLSAEELRERARTELNQIPIYRQFEAHGIIRTTADGDLAVHDSLLMELAYLEPGSVDRRDVGLTQFQDFVVQHELLRQNAEQLNDRHFQLADPRPWEVLTGRARFTEIARHCLKFANDLQMIRAYWDEMNDRSRNRLKDAAMGQELERLATRLMIRVNDLVARANTRERHGKNFEYKNLVHLAHRLNQNSLLLNCQSWLTSRNRQHQRQQKQALTEQVQQLDVVERRGQWTVISNDEFPDPRDR